MTSRGTALHSSRSLLIIHVQVPVVVAILRKLSRAGLSSKILTSSRVLSRVSSQVRKTLVIALLLEKCEASSLLEPSLPGLVSLVPLLIASDLIWRCAATTRKCGRLSCLTSKTLLVAKNGKQLDSKPL
jgi:hypothetical protein